MKKQTLLNIIKKGGSTLNYKGRQINFREGYQVSLKDLYIFNLKDIDAILKAINEQLDKLSFNGNLGLWVDEGKMYIDLSFNIKQFKRAVEIGKLYNQLSIFDWSTKKCIFLAEV